MDENKKLSKKKSWDEISKIIDEKYPEAFYYYALGKIFGWTPDIIDGLDIALCRVLIEIDMKKEEEQSDEISGTSRTKENKTPSMPDEWKTMSVKDILASQEYEDKEKDNDNLLRSMKNTRGGQTEVVKNYLKIE